MLECSTLCCGTSHFGPEFRILKSWEVKKCTHRFSSLTINIWYCNRVQDPPNLYRFRLLLGWHTKKQAFNWQYKEKFLIENIPWCWVQVKLSRKAWKHLKNIIGSTGYYLVDIKYYFCPFFSFNKKKAFNVTLRANKLYGVMRYFTLSTSWTYLISVR